jgi:hypothetical protein
VFCGGGARGWIADYCNFLLVVPAFSTLRGPVGVVGVERVGVVGGGCGCAVGS